jgi:hypothetical protein
MHFSKCKDHQRVNLRELGIKCVRDNRSTSIRKNYSKKNLMEEKLNFMVRYRVNKWKLLSKLSKNIKKIWPNKDKN